jgi:hypothetical protein
MKKPPEEFDEKEAQARFEAALRGALKTKTVCEALQGQALNRESTKI